MPPTDANVTPDTTNIHSVQGELAREEGLNDKSSEQTLKNAQLKSRLSHGAIQPSSQERNDETTTTSTESGKARNGVPYSRSCFHKVFSFKNKTSPKPFLPITHRAPLLLTISAGCIVLLVLLEVLSRKNNRDGGIMFAQDGESLGPGQQFTYLYLPTIIAVCGSMIWSWIDLDVKRLESFFQLSKPGGASGSDSVLLSYPVDFLALVPITAARRRHYTVMAAGVAMCLIFWVITPLQVSFRLHLPLIDLPGLTGARLIGCHFWNGSDHEIADYLEYTFNRTSSWKH